MKLLVILFLLKLYARINKFFIIFIKCNQALIKCLKNFIVMLTLDLNSVLDSIDRGKISSESIGIIH